MTNTNLFFLTIKNKGIKFNFIAQKAELTPNGLRKKVNNETEFKATEIFLISDVLNLSLTEREAIFFAEM